MANRPLRVLYATHEPNLTGASRSLLDMINAMPRDEVEPTVLLRADGPLIEKLDQIGVAHITVPSALSVKGPQSKYPTYAMEAVNRIAVYRVARILRKEGFDLVHNNSLLSDIGMRSACRTGLPFICHVRELVAEDHGLAFCNESRMQRLMSQAAAVIFISNFVADKFKSIHFKNKTKILYNGLDTKQYIISGHQILEGDTARLILAGRFQPGKGQLDAVRAVELLNASGVHVELTLIGGIGSPDYYKECKNYIHKHNLLNIVHIEPFSDDLTQMRSAADMSLMCSKSEAMGRVTVEGMLAGCLVIGSDSGATPYLIENQKTGLLYNNGNIESLAACIAYAITHKKESRQIAANGQNWANRAFDSSNYSRKMIKLYKEVLNGIGKH